MSSDVTFSTSFEPLTAEAGVTLKSRRPPTHQVAPER